VGTSNLRPKRAEKNEAVLRRIFLRSILCHAYFRQNILPKFSYLFLLFPIFQEAFASTYQWSGRPWLTKRNIFTNTTFKYLLLYKIRTSLLLQIVLNLQKAKKQMLEKILGVRVGNFQSSVMAEARKLCAEIFRPTVRNYYKLRV